MKKVTLISYPTEPSNLLSLTDHSSRYEMYYGGRFRVLDFILSLALYIDTNKIILLEPHFSESLEHFTEDPYTKSEFPPLFIEKINRDYDYPEFLKLLIDTDESDYFLFLNGDNPLFGLIRDKIKELLDLGIDFAIINLKVGKKEEQTQLLLTRKDKIIKIIQDKFKVINNFNSFFSKLADYISKEKNFKTISVDGFFAPVHNLYDYLNANFKFLNNLKILLPMIKQAPLGNIIAPMFGESIIRKQGYVKHSLISDNCEIFGQVENSILFPNVTILKKSVIKNSIILPNTVIGEQCKIYRTIIDETFENTKLKKSLPTIGDESIIGSETTNGSDDKNSIFPDAISKGVTLIGPNCVLPKKIQVGSACYIKGGTDKLILKKNAVVKDTETV